MNETPVPDAAVQIVRGMWISQDDAQAAVAALHAAGWLCDPAEMVTVDDDACTYCGTPIPDHGLDCAHHLRVEREHLRTRVAELEKVERARRIPVSWIDDADDDDAGYETGWIRAVEGDQAVIDCDCGPRIVRRPLTKLKLWTGRAK